MDSKKLKEIAQYLGAIAEHCPATSKDWFDVDGFMAENLTQPQWEAYNLGQIVGMQYERNKLVESVQSNNGGKQ